MAKISTYPQPTPPQLSDYVIGTDVSDAKMTKNFLLSDILNLATTTGQFVTVDGVQTITGSKTFDYGTSEGVVASVTINVPAQTQTVLSPDALLIYINGQTPTSTPGFVGGVVVSASGLDNVCYYASLGSTSGTSQGIFIDSNDAHTGDFLIFRKRVTGSPTTVKFSVLSTGTVYISNSISLVGSEGTVGQVMVSNGPSNAPSWQTLGRGHFVNQASQTYIVTPPLPNGMYVNFNTAIGSETSGITLLTNQRIRFNSSGTYRLSLSLSVRNNNTSFFPDTCNVWLMKNGVNIPYTNRIFTVATTSSILFSNDYVITVALNDYIEVGFSTLGEDISLEYSPADLYYPVTPSAAMIINKI